MVAGRRVTIADADFMFENKIITVTANRNETAFELAGLKVGPFEEGREYEARFWVARELEQAGIVRFREEDMLDVVKLHKIHWKERVQPTNQVSSLSEDFYPRLRRYLSTMETTTRNDPGRVKDLEKSTQIALDITNCRVKKIVAMASSPPLTAQALQSLTPEERALYHHLFSLIDEWKSRILAER